jgi:hypothetical protein
MNAARTPAEVPDRLTAIQLRADGELTARLLCGGPFPSVGGAAGEIALLPPGRVAAYLLARRRMAGVYVFRTASDGRGTTIPGVSRPVVLLLSGSRRGVARRIRNFVRKLTSYGYDPSQLTDEFWTRAAGALLARRRPSHHLVAALLAREVPGLGAALRARRGRFDGDRFGVGCLTVDSKLHAESAPGRVLATARAPCDDRRSR